ncbi:hypothetical protein H1Z61_13245 [Bacillus aquiflavi]|uniref:Short-chain dehydrogenase n=1 Tax=Bacillus aquiflavi TaxID=2672567 RepID=A0A6B3VVV0_9BACI|nr:hypothetical protein [Bacillus aquiflavi]MBA4538071.1 hypothetical protein [Bacillus aquiflavi]NEY82370.1 hypothetical protein [Bacillus aquiflavi]UAC49229.1 hypothetical protein K6959_04955 [Bacillus aquiflavi]
MSLYLTTILIVLLGILVFSLIYTWIIGRGREKVKGELDSEIPEQAQEHAYIRNPIFIAYAAFFVILLLIIVYAASL